MEQLLSLALILACPLMMMLMIRGSHCGHGNHTAGDHQAHAKGWLTATRASPIMSIKLPAVQAAGRSTTYAAPAGRR